MRPSVQQLVRLILAVASIWAGTNAVYGTGEAIFIPGSACVVSVLDNPSDVEYQARLDWCKSFYP